MEQWCHVAPVSEDELGFKEQIEEGAAGPQARLPIGAEG